MAHRAVGHFVGAGQNRRRHAPQGQRGYLLAMQISVPLSGLNLLKPVHAVLTLIEAAALVGKPFFALARFTVPLPLPAETSATRSQHLKTQASGRVDQGTTLNS
jgi:hypothetical protein